MRAVMEFIFPVFGGPAVATRTPKVKGAGSIPGVKIENINFDCTSKHLFI